MSRAALAGGVGAAAAVLMVSCGYATYGGPYPPYDGGQPDASVEDARDAGEAAPVDATSDVAADGGA